MELNLKKARKLESKITTLLSEQSINAEGKVRIKSTIVEAQNELSKQKVEVASKVENKLKLINAKFVIRKSIDDKNHESGINALMNLRAQLIESKKEYSKLIEHATAKKLLSQEELEDLLEAKKARLEKGTTGLYSEPGTNAEIGVFSDEDIEKLKETLQTINKQLEDTEDSLSEKNISTKVTLELETIGLLKSNKLL